MINFCFHLSYGYLAPLVVIFVLVLFRGQTVGAGVPGYLAVLVAGSVAMAISVVLADAQLAFVLCMLSWLFVWMAYLPSFPLGRALGGILIAMVLFTVALGTARPEDLVAGFWTQVFIGIVVAVAFDRLMWPRGVEDSLHEALAAVFGDFARGTEDLGWGIRARHLDARAPEADLAHIEEVSSVLRHVFRGKSEAEFQLKFRLWLIWDRFHVFKRHVQTDEFLSLPDPFISDLDDIVSDYAYHFRELADVALDGRRAVSLSMDTRQKVEDFVESLRDVRFREPGTADQTLSAATLIKLMTHSLVDHVRLVDAYNAILESELVNKSRPADGGDAPAGLFSWPAAGTWKVSAKVTVITLILLVGVTYLDFPGSSVVAFYGVTFGLMVNLGQLYMKGMTGILGAVAGLAYGIIGVLIVVQSPHLFVLLGVFALGVFVAAYVATGEESVAFMGLQAALLTPYVFLIFEGPEWTLSNAITRASALAIAAVVAVVVQRLLWPVDPLVMFRTVTARALEDIAQSWRQLWQRDPNGDVIPRAAAPDVPEALIRSFSQCAAWLKDSRYLVGSEYVAAKRYSRILGSLEEVLAEFHLLERLLQEMGDNSLIEGARHQLVEPIDTIARGIEALAFYYRHPAHADDLNELVPQLARVQDLTIRRRSISGSVADAPLEDQRIASVLLHTTSDMARSLSSVVDATLAMSAMGTRGPGRGRGGMSLAHIPGQ